MCFMENVLGVWVRSILGYGGQQLMWEMTCNYYTHDVLTLPRGRHLLRFGYLGKWSPCAYESLSTKGEDFYPHTLLYDSNFTLT